MSLITSRVCLERHLLMESITLYHKNIFTVNEKNWNRFAKNIFFKQNIMKDYWKIFILGISLTHSSKDLMLMKVETINWRK